MIFANQEIGQSHPVFFVLGPCAAESYDVVMKAAETVALLQEKHRALFIFKSSYCKANRTSGTSYRGPGIEEGLKLLNGVKEYFNLPIISDIHETSQITEATKILDILQIPAFLSRQTGLIEDCARTGKTVMIKKGQFMSPEDCLLSVDKARNAAIGAFKSDDNVLVCERGTSFGYNDVIVDFRGLYELKKGRCPIVFDVSHTATFGHDEERQAAQQCLTPVLARAAVAAGASGIFIETHPDPEKALCDQKTQYPLDKIANLVRNLIDLDSFLRPKI